MRNHTKLRAFQLADQVALEIYSLTRSFPEDERFGLTSQLRRAAISIGANIVEGAARISESEFLRFLGIAYGSAKELQYELSLAIRLGMVEPDRAQCADRLALQTSKALWSLINTIRRSTSLADNRRL